VNEKGPWLGLRWRLSMPVASPDRNFEQILLSDPRRYSRRRETGDGKCGHRSPWNHRASMGGRKCSSEALSFPFWEKNKLHLRLCLLPTRFSVSWNIRSMYVHPKHYPTIVLLMDIRIASNFLNLKILQLFLEFDTLILKSIPVK
jgi:hypothetical protein